MAVIKTNEPFRDKHPKKPRSSSSDSVIRNNDVKEGRLIILKKAEVTPEPAAQAPGDSPTNDFTPIPAVNMQDELIKQRRLMEATLKQEQDMLRQKAHREGYERGYEEGKAQFSTLAKQTLDTINSIISERNRILEQSETPILELATTIAKKVTQSVVKDNPDVFHNIFREALDKVTDKGKVVVRINPSDLKMAQHYTAALQQELKDFKSLEIISDQDIEQGGCVIETNLGYIDSSISTKFNIIESALKNTKQGRL